MLLPYLTVCIVFLEFAYGQNVRTPTISYISQEQIVNIGGTVQMECSVQYATDFPVVWMKLDQNGQQSTPLTHGSSLILNDNRFSLRTDAASSTYTLQIRDIQEADAGIYQCGVLISVSNRITAQVPLVVRMPPVISDNSTRSVVKSEGEYAKLECYAGGFPPPRISWRRQNNAVLPTGGAIYRGNVIEINNITKEHRGTYYCVAENFVGKGQRRNIAVEVEFAPVVTATRPRLGQALSYDMVLECRVEAFPAPAISWHKDNFQLSNNQHYKISNFATADELTITTLRVVTIEKKQYGEFTCRAANKLGVSQAKVELFEMFVPVCPPACGQTIYSGGKDVQARLSPILLLVPLTLPLYTR
ncbi:unnamed protein product [Cyprideis torosa]|uniref:Uncharacterized protein n=1 Tax=Cyprideis torosa TaxID=163714 RepID=A0A7R8ZM36_9CRUS|nr:unnamed protein product [Cyprideis torosa]CAG0884968.1 unnamed protein product [Cyprideis torosa]